MTDIAVVGAGVVGLAFALAAARQGFAVELFDKKHRPEKLLEASSNVLAINSSSRRFLQEEGVWNLIQKTYKTPYSSMIVKDGTGMGVISFSAADMDLDELGFIVDQKALLFALAKAADDQTNLRVNWKTDFDSASVTVPLVVGSDGVHSNIRKQLRLQTIGFDYQQTATVCLAKVSKPHGNCARQWFLNSGPVAFLPLSDQLRVAVIWSSSSSKTSLGETRFLEELYRASEGELGCISIIGSRFEFPLRQQQALQYVREGFALLGDAAHSVHPLAGQGANLGLSDASVLVAALCAARVEGLQPGELSVLKRYEKQRRPDNYLTALAMEGFHRVFTSSSLWSRLLRNHGLRFVGRNSALKKLAVGFASN